MVVHVECDAHFVAVYSEYTELNIESFCSRQNWATKFDTITKEANDSQRAHKTQWAMSVTKVSSGNMQLN